MTGGIRWIVHWLINPLQVRWKLSCDMKWRQNRKKDTTLLKQLLRSGSSVSANINEAVYGNSKADFIAKLHIALKEADVTNVFGLFSNKDVMHILAKNCLLLNQKPSFGGSALFQRQPLRTPSALIAIVWQLIL